MPGMAKAELYSAWVMHSRAKRRKAEQRKINHARQAKGKTTRKEPTGLPPIALSRHRFIAPVLQIGLYGGRPTLGE